MADLDIQVAVGDDFDEMAVFDGLVFGEPWPEPQRELAKSMIDFDRFRVVRDGGRIVALAGSYGMEVTVPGGAQVPAGGVTWVAVAATHRRRGILTRLMAELHADIDRRREPLAMLTASEGGIYERFDYGIASYLRVTEIDRRRTQVTAAYQPPPGSVALTDLDDPDLPGIFDRYRRARVGEIDRTTAYDALVKAELGDGVGVAKHADGFAVWKVSANWNDGHPEHTMSLKDVVAITPDAHAALWHTILSVDLVGRITSFRAVALDDALPYIVSDQRAVRTTNVNDMLWIHVRDVAAALRARTYGTDDRLVIEIDGEPGGRWRVDGDPTGAHVRRARSKPDVTMTPAALGAIYLGGVRPSTLARGNRLRATSTDVLRRADAFFMAERLPHCSTGF